MSLRRVKKGPGRRPLSAKRKRFVELRERGWSIRGAAREIGISRTTANNWSRGYKVYRRGELVGFVPPLERLAVRQISARFLSQDERVELADLQVQGMGVRQIARRLGGRRRRSPGSCAATPSRVGTTGRSMRSGGRRRGALAIPVGGWRPRLHCERWSWTCRRSGGVRSRSAAGSGSGFPTSPGCGCLTRASIRRSTSRDRRCCDPHRWRRTDAPHCAPDVTTAAHNSTSSGAGRGSSSRC